MYKKIKIKDIYGNDLEVEIKTLSLEYLDKIMELQDYIINKIENKKIFAKTERYEFENIINKDGEVIGVTTGKDQLIAFGAMVIPGRSEFNLGYDLNFNDDNLLKVAHIESTVVHPQYRGNGIQKMLCSYLENNGIKKGATIFCATVSPENQFSLRSILSLDYKIALEKEKYGGLKRYIVTKCYCGKK